MFKKNISIALPEKHDEDILLKFIENKQINKYLRLEKKIAHDHLYFRYLIDSRLGVIYAVFQKEKNNISINVKEPLSGLFSIIVFFISGIGLLLFYNAGGGAFLIGMAFVFLYIRYYNFQEAVIDIRTVIEKELKGMK